MGCVIDLREEHGKGNLALPVPLRLECPSPVDPDCALKGDLVKHIRWIEAHDWDYYHKYIMKQKKHVYISSRWVAMGDCGTNNRVYVREDGALVISHDQEGYEGVHVIVFEQPLWRILGYNSIRDIESIVKNWRMR